MIKKPKIIVILCGEAAIFCLTEGMETRFRIFCQSPEYVDKTDLPKLLAKYAGAPVYILLDSPELTVNKHVLPGVSSLAIAKLAQRRLERDFNEDDLKCAVNCGRESGGRKDWRYLFVNMPMTSDLTRWMDFLLQFPNPIMGLHFLPMEAKRLAEQIRLADNKKVKRKKKVKTKTAAKPEIKDSNKDKEKGKEWLFLSLTQKTGGVRQIIFEDGQLFFTRYVRYPLHAAPETVAGVIEQEMANTVDYLRRLSYTDKDSTRAVVATSNEIKASLADSDFGGIETAIYTPYELSLKIGLTGACRIDDKYTDILAAVAFISSKPTVRIFTDKTVKSYRMAMGAKVAKVASIATVPLFLGLCGYYSMDIMKSKDEALKLENKKASLTKQYNADANRVQSIDQEEEKAILSAAAVYSDLQSEPQPTPLVITQKMAGAPLSSAKIKDMKWSYAPADKQGRGARKEAQENLRISLDFYNSGGSAESLFNNFEEFSRNVGAQFQEGYMVEYSKLPDKLTFNNKTDVVPVTITVRSGEEEKGRRGRR